MTNIKERIYSNELIDIIHKSESKMNDIKLKLGGDGLVNQGIFLMVNAYFEGTLRDVL